MIRLWLVVAAALAVLGTGAASAGERVGDFLIFSKTSETIVLDAEIGTGTVSDFHRALARSPRVKVVLLRSPGGNVDEALRLADEIRQRGLSTAIPSDFSCYSACIYLFFAGREHVVRGRLGVHHVSIEGLDDASAAGVYDDDVKQALRRYGASAGVIKVMDDTPPSQLHVFSREEIATYAINRAAGHSLATKYANG